MSTPLLLALLLFVIVLGATAGVWRARERGGTSVQAALSVLLVAVVAAVLTWLVLRGR